MKNYAIVCDSSVSISAEDAKRLNVKVAPLTIIHNNKDYYDQVDLTTEQVNDLLREKEVLKTSQPNVGYLINFFEDLKSQDFDHIFVLSLTSSLSGTYMSFNQALSEVKLDNVTLIDTYTLAGPVQNAAESIQAMNELDSSVEEIVKRLQYEFKFTESFVYPQTLDQLKVSGRISNSAALLASLLKVKPLLFLENHGKTIEKFATARTEAKIFESMIKEMQAKNVNAKDYVLYFLHSEGRDTVDRLNQLISEKLGDFEHKICNLPAALATHAGLGTIALQWSLKFKR
ncbi:MAG: DegV family protein [Erysipelothrix sp.]